MGRRCGGVKSLRRRDEGTRPNRLKGLPLFSDPSSHRRGNAPGRPIGFIPATRPLISVYLHTCAKLIKAELIQVLVIFEGCFVLFFFLSKLPVFNFTA